MASLIHVYLEELGRSLSVGSRLKQRILCESEDHLLESVQAHQEGGLSLEEAELRAISNFGSPKIIAWQFASDLATSSVRVGSNALFPLALCLQLVSQFGYHLLPVASRPRNVMMIASLATAINLYSLGFQLAVVAFLFAFWRVMKHQGKIATPIPPYEMPFIAGAQAIGYIILAVALSLPPLMRSQRIPFALPRLKAGKHSIASKECSPACSQDMFFCQYFLIRSCSSLPRSSRGHE